MMTISIDSAAILTQRSKRTWYRRIEDGSIAKVGNDAAMRTMIRLADVMTLIPISMTAEDMEYLVRADAGDPEAQDDIGQLFLAAGKHGLALYWLNLAAAQNYPNAMQCLGSCYLSGQGVPQDDNLAIMWLAKAAAHKSLIAQAQIDALRPRLM